MKLKRGRFLSRELSWLDFNQRVLEAAKNVANPPLERLKFLAITGSNLDEFFMVRVGGLIIMRRAGKRTRDVVGMTPKMRQEAIAVRAREMVAEQYACLRELLRETLPAHGLRLLAVDELDERQAARLREMLHDDLFPVLTPMVLGSAEEGPAPTLQGLKIHVAVHLAAAAAGEADRLAVIPLGGPLERLLPVPSPTGSLRLVLIEDAVQAYVHNWFPGCEIRETSCFRLTRNADIAVQEDEAADLLAGMEGVLEARKDSDCIRLELAAGTSPALEKLLRRRLCTRYTDVYRVDGLLDLKSLMSVAFVDGFDELKDSPWVPQLSPAVDSAQSLFEQIKANDLLLYHPYETYNPVVRFLEEAAEDRGVLAIKQILYRTSSRSPIIAALKRAAESGKYVTVLVELKARFDEERNINWARQLEQAGAQVIYGVKGLKTHAKVCLVVRRERDGIVRYAHFGTGNYNEVTAKLYGDISYLTCNPELVADASIFFNAICGYSQPVNLRRLVVAPFALRDRLLEMIDAEIERAKHKLKARIDAKLNALVDTALIEKLYEASKAGVKIRLNVRGTCCLRPGVAGLSENISVLSIIDRFLEHARIIRFHQGGDELVFISSADWMPRNLDRRVELLVPVEEPACKQRLVEILELHLGDTTKGWWLNKDGKYSLRAKARGKGSQELLYTQAKAAIEAARQTRPTIFEPHRPQP